MPEESKSERSDPDDSEWENALVDPLDLSSWYGDVSSLPFMGDMPEVGEPKHREKHPGGQSFSVQ